MQFPCAGYPGSNVSFLSVFAGSAFNGERVRANRYAERKTANKQKCTEDKTQRTKQQKNNHARVCHHILNKDADELMFTGREDGNIGCLEGELAHC